MNEFEQSSRESTGGEGHLQGSETSSSNSTRLVEVMPYVLRAKALLRPLQVIGHMLKKPFYEDNLQLRITKQPREINNIKSKYTQNTEPLKTQGNQHSREL